MLKTRRSPWTLPVALMAALALVASACGGDDAAPGTTGAPGTTVAGGEPQRGGDLAFGRAHDNSSMDPVETVETATIYVLDHIFETLFVTSPDGSEAIPWLASDYEVSEDGTVYTVTLREGVLFNDGSPMTSADVKWSIERAAADSPFGFLLGAIDTIDAPDNLTVVFNLLYAWAPFLADLSVWAAGIVPADFGGKSYEEFFAAPVGTGPFMLDEWVRGTSLRLVRNPNYWQEGKPYVDSVTWYQVPNDQTRIVQLEDGRLDIISDVPLESMAALDARDDVVANSFPATTTFWISFNVTEPPFDNVHARRAVAYGIDVTGMAGATLFGFGGPACSVISPAVPYHDPNTPCLRYDRDAARAELELAGMPDGFSAEFLVQDMSPNLPIAEIIQDQLADVGINITIRTIDPGQHYSTIFVFDYQMAYTGWTMDIPDPDQKISFMFDFELGGGDSYSTGFDDPEMTALVRAGQTETDPAERARIYAEIQALAAELAVFVPLVVQDGPFAWRADVRGFLVNPVGKRNLENVWLDR